VFFRDEHRVYRTAGFESIPWLEYAFGTRAALSWPETWELATLRQIHSAKAVIVRDPVSAVAEGDALITDRPGLLVGVRTADCLPILLVEQHKRVVSAVHAGWRGTLAGVVANTVRRMTEECGADPACVCAAIGPGIGKCCFVVSPEVAVRFQPLFPERDDLDRRASIDLVEANRRILREVGVPDEQIYCGAPCNCCLASEFYSHRRDPRDGGRMLSVLGIRP